MIPDTLWYGNSGPMARGIPRGLRGWFKCLFFKSTSRYLVVSEYNAKSAGLRFGIFFLSPLSGLSHFFKVRLVDLAVFSDPKP